MNAIFLLLRMGMSMKGHMSVNAPNKIIQICQIDKKVAGLLYGDRQIKAISIQLFGKKYDDEIIDVLSCGITETCHSVLIEEECGYAKPITSAKHTFS